MVSSQQIQTPVYQLKVTLLHAEGPIWRRILVPSEMTLHDLHLTIQIAMGWTNSHLYLFRIAGEEFSEPLEREIPVDTGFQDSRAACLGQFVPASSRRFIYEYDFGDSWEHEVALERELEREPGRPYPFCVQGKRACPPEDCGGVLGFSDVLEVSADPNNEQYAELVEWLGVAFDPDSLDLDGINDELIAQFGPSRRG